MAVAGLSTSGEGRIVLTARHSQALRAGIEAICAAALIGDVRRSAELVALHLREAPDQLGPDHRPGDHRGPAGAGVLKILYWQVGR